MKHYFIKFTQLLCFVIANLTIAQDVNQFTGSLNYGVPLLSVPSDRGKSVPVMLSYGGNGIYVSQPASEVGLGWGLSSGGSIIRSVRGIPDDFEGPMFNQITKTFDTQRGLLSSSGPTSGDILNSRRNLDSTEFYFPNYDNYSVSGPGIGGSMSPMILNYMAFSRDVNGNFNYDSGNSGAWVRPQFIFNGDFSDTLISRHYPTTPIDPYTPFHMPKDIITGDYHNDATPYFGKKGNGLGAGENYNPTSNRLGTANYVEYVISPYDNHTIIAFKITNSGGFVYTYDLPVYSNSSVNYTYPLNNDYSIPRYTANGTNTVAPKVGSASQYYVEHTYPSNTGTFVTEVKESNSIPTEWKLTSITGPDYQEVGNNGFDAADKGYWVVFEYKLWTNDFSTRYPALGFNYMFGMNEKTANYPIVDNRKRSGKVATASVNNEQVYYINSIKTSSHKAIFVRDVRNDEVGTIPNYDAALNDSLLISPTATTTALHGRIFDEGGPSSGYVSCVSTSGNVTTTNYMKTIQLGNISSLVLKFNSLNLNKCQNSPTTFRYDNLHIYAGPNDTYPEISFTYTSTTYTSPFNTSPYNNAPVVPIGVDITLNNYTATAITFKIEKFCIGAAQHFGSGWDIEWHAITNKRMPQLFVKRVLLFDNSVTGTPTFTSAINSITSSNSDFDFSGTSASSSPPFNENWYQANKTAIDAVTLKGNELVYDYSLSNKYHKNINVKENRTTRLSSPSVVQSNLTVNTVTVGTGKLALNKIIPTELGGVQLYPTIKFDYNSSITNDNPDYDPRKTDYWGYYKSDVSSLGYYGYTTPTSKDYTDAWLLRKITSAMGGITEIEYESNSYSKVLKGNGGFRGPSRIYPIKSIVGGSVYLEEGSNLPEDLSAVYNATAVATHTPDIFVPTILDQPADPTDYNNPITNFFGRFTYTYNAGTPLPIIPSINGYIANATIGVPTFTDCSTTGPGLFLSAASVGDNDYFKYTGNGWVRFTMPVSTNTVYGAGSRVKKIINRNGTSDAYITLYEYQDGVALAEADRFTNPIARYPNYGANAVHEKLSPAGNDPYDLPATIGYSKVLTKDLGQVNAAKGWTETYFNTTDVVGDFFQENIDNFKANISNKSSFTATIPPPFTNSYVPAPTICARIDTGISVEYVDRFSPYWGLTKENRVYDVNNNMLSRNIYEYEGTEQGALVENFVFGIAEKLYTGPVNYYMSGTTVVWVDPCLGFVNTNKTWQACIKRKVPVVLKRTTSYGMGTKSITEMLKCDELTGEQVITQIRGDNYTSALTIKVPAFRISTFASMGAKSINPSYKNILGAEAYFYSVIDSSLTTPSGASTDFSGAVANVYSQSVLTRGYNSGTNTYTNTTVTLPNWINKSSFSWVGDVGSIDTYGLYKKSELSANPFNYNNPYSSSNKWRFGGELSLLDNKGHTIEKRLFNNKFTSTKLNFAGKYVLSQISNCNYLSFTYSGFEYIGTSGTTDGEINVPASNTTLIDPDVWGGFIPHTGKYVAQVLSGGMGPNYSVSYNGTGTYGEELGLLRDRIYRASVWTHTTSVSGARIVINLDGSVGGVATAQTVSMTVTDSKAVTIGAWKLLYVDIKVPANYLSSGGTTNKLTAYVDVQGGGTAYFDDFQFHPIESEVKSKVYDTNGRITAEINDDGYATKYTYDAAGRLTATYQEIPGVGLKLIKTNSYNYARGTN